LVNKYSRNTKLSFKRIIDLSVINIYLKKKITMAIMITDECINCGACEPECPNNAIYEGGVQWAIADGTDITGDFTLENGLSIQADTQNEPVSEDYYYIVPDKCTECVGFHEEPQCAAVCPVDCCVPDPNRQETEETLLARKDRLHL
jgi:ferredoxin